MLRSSDVFLDQFVISGYGVAAIEAMAYGKPVVCYIAPSVAEHYPAELPIVNAGQDDLAASLESLLKDVDLLVYNSAPGSPLRVHLPRSVEHRPARRTLR